MSVVVTEDVRRRAEVYQGDEICQEKLKEMLKEICLPNGLLPLKDIHECGYNRDTGFFWLKQNKSYTHKFHKLGKQVSYAPEVTGYAQKGKITKITGVKSKQLMIWITVSDIYVDDPSTDKITFQVPTGQSKQYPISAFHIQEDTKQI